MSSEVAQLKAEIKRLRAERTAWKQRAIESAADEREACVGLADEMLRGVDAMPLIEAIRTRGNA